MLTFAVFDGPRSLGAARLMHAHLVGPDNVPVGGEIACENGRVVCRKRIRESVSLALQVRLPSESEDGPRGDMVLRTCQLRDRDEPYLLSLELARRQLMTVITKLEQWSLFDLPSGDPVIRAFEAAREAMTEALVVAAGAGPTERSERAALEALRLGLEAGEALALRHGADEVARRARGAPPPTLDAVALTEPVKVGCSVAPSAFSPALQRFVGDSCDFVVMPMRWLDMEPTEGRYAFANTDRWIEWAVRKAKKPVMGGPLIDFSPRSTPEWLYIWEHDYETLRELVYEHVRQIVTRYRRTVSVWTVAAGLHVNCNFSFKLEQVMDLTRMTASIVRKLQPRAVVQVDVSEPWGEHYAVNPRSAPPTLYAEMVAQSGLGVDRLGIRIEMGQPTRGGVTRGLLALSDLIDRYAEFDLPLSISALSAPSRTPEAPPAAKVSAMDRIGEPSEGGSWHGEWNDQMQADWLGAALLAAAGKPSVESVVWGELMDLPPHPQTGVESRKRYDGLFREDGTPKPAASKLGATRAMLRDPAEASRNAEPDPAR